MRQQFAFPAQAIAAAVYEDVAEGCGSSGRKARSLYDKGVIVPVASALEPDAAEIVIPEKEHLLLASVPSYVPAAGEVRLRIGRGLLNVGNDVCEAFQIAVDFKRRYVVPFG